MQGLVLERAAHFPVLTLTGPRQSGKTTLCRMAFPDKPYANLELPDVRAFASTDPRGFLSQYPQGAILDEIQRVPDLLSYIQGIVDDHQMPGEFVLTGSQHFSLIDGISQSLAGRTAVLHLLPLSLDELWRFPDPPRDLNAVLLAGAYPRIHDRNIPHQDWLASYVETYLERDVRQVKRIGDLKAFQNFLELCAGRIGQLLNLSSLGADCGITHNTAKQWLSVLEAGFIAFRLTPFHRNLRKRITKSPKLYFYDTGLACYLLGIRSAEELKRHPLRGALFEGWAISEVLKARKNKGLDASLSFYRDHRGAEVDLIVEGGMRCLAVEMKSGQTLPADAFDSLQSFARTTERAADPIDLLEQVVIYGGDQQQRRSRGTALPWSEIPTFNWTQV